MLANFKTPASYFDPLYINFSNVGVTSNVRRAFFEDVNAGTALKLSYSSCLMFRCVS